MVFGHRIGWRMYLFVLIFITNIIFTQELVNAENKQTNSYFSFRHYDSDKYYIAWMNPRSFVSRAYIKHNFDLKSALLYRNPQSEVAWNFNTITAVLEGRIATEIYLFRTPKFAIGVGAAFEVPLIIRKKLELTESKLNILNLYSIIGQTAAFIDVYLPYEMKLRIIPVFHESVHIADGYVGNSKDFSFISYEFVALELYSKIKWATLYTGIEVTFHASAESERLLRTRVHFGADLRYPIWKDTISVIMGFNIAALYDEKNTKFLETSGWHPAVNFGMGIEFDRVITSFKISYQRGFESVTYQTMQTSLGMEVTVLF
ncbi:MAG: hypothetical protein KFW21_01170 [Spirochaetota bacterium]|nr:hypothetical protein [Spirochaetota bacterium]